jgi:beta-N-acetylhexosaminidase
MQNDYKKREIVMKRIMKISGVFCLLGLMLIANPSESPSLNTAHGDWAQSKLATMSQEEKIAQLFMIEVRPTLGKAHLDEVERMVTNHQIGGLIFFKGDPLTEVRLTNKYQGLSKIPMFIAIDGEWGLSMRLSQTVAYPYQMALGGLEGQELVYQMGRQVGKQCKRMGIHINFAPTIDINNNPANPVINYRSFGEDRENVANKGWAYAKGMQDERVIACAKHFPGHGDTDTDSHLDLPVIKHNRKRLDSLEMYPFRRLIDSGVMSVMTAHLYIPAIDATPNQAISISEKAINGILKKEMGFDGLAITDALNMKGVAKFYQPGELDLKALIAGNDILLAPGNVPKAIDMIEAAIKKGTITQKYLDDKVKKILMYKRWAGIETFTPISEENLISDLNTNFDQMLLAKMAEQEISLVRDADHLLPLKVGKNQKIGSLVIGLGGDNEFHKSLKQYANISTAYTSKNANYDVLMAGAKKLNDAEVLIISLHGTSKFPSSNYGVPSEAAKFIRDISQKRKVIFANFGNAYNLKNFANVPTIVLAYEDNPINHAKVAQVLFAAIGTKAKLPVTVNQEYKVKMGLLLSAKDLLTYGHPWEVNLNAHVLNKIDTIVNKAIIDGATPGCQVLIAKDGKVVFQRAYGTTLFESNQKVTNDMLYDLASITKVASTTLSIMKLYEQGKLALDDPLSKYLPGMDTTNKKDITIKQVLTHKAGLKDWVPFYVTVMDDSTARDSVFSLVKNDKYCVECGSGIYMNTNYLPVIIQKIYETPVKSPGEYKYSDMGMILLRFVIQNITKMPLEDYVQQTFYQPMGMMTMTYRPLEKFSKDLVVPTEMNPDFRKGQLQGYVHDPAAAMLGGVSGHAGLFSNSTDLAILMQMLLNGGTFNGQRFFTSETVRLFTSQQDNDSRRGLGFDRVELRKGWINPVSDSCSLLSFGHSGFTGTQVWADPKSGFIYVFLSNRVSPSSENRILIKTNVRTNIMDVMYQSILPASLN